MDILEAKAFFKEYNGLEFHMCHDVTRKNQEYRSLHITEISKNRWRREIIKEIFVQLEKESDQTEYGVLIGNLIEVLQKIRDPIEDDSIHMISCLQGASHLDEKNKIQILEHMAGHGQGTNDGGIYLVCTRSRKEEELRQLLEPMGRFACSSGNQERYHRALQKIKKAFQDGRRERTDI